MVKLAKKKVIDRDVYSLALDRMHAAFDRFDTVAVSFSGGKDSTACLNLALEVARDRGERRKLVTFFFDEEAIPYETEEYVRRVAETEDVRLLWLCLPIQHRNACSRRSPFWYPWAPEDRERWVRQLPPEAITHVDGWPDDPERRHSMPDSVGLLFPVKEYGITGMVMGIRADESLTRTRAILNMGQREDNHIVEWKCATDQGNLWKVYPVYDWSTEDIWTAPRKFGWDYNHAYDVYDRMGVQPDDQRCAPPFGEEPLRGLYQFAEAFPDIWHRMQSRVPGANTAAMYSRTELYSYGKRPDKPEGVSWEDFIKSWVEKHDQPVRSQVAQTIQGWIVNHWRKCGEPILDVPHYMTGVDWNFLLMIAVRGDLKNRKQPRTPMTSAERQMFEERYNARRRELSANQCNDVAA